jgi:predicted ATPase/DNA-binding CsgD family transcriptional regulator/transcriptional regulator with XRE-family HTH domain
VGAPRDRSPEGILTSAQTLPPEELRARRTALALTQTQLAAALGATPKTVGRWERGELQISDPSSVRLVFERLESSAARKSSHPIGKCDSEARTHSAATGHAPSGRSFERAHAHHSADPELETNRKGEARRYNLPASLTSFVGREGALAEAQQLLDTSRLLTLVGSGGIGKTRLALRIAHELVDVYEEGVWLVDLAPVADPLLVPLTVAAALGVPEQPGRPLLVTLAEHLAARQVLLILDNCEHLVPASAELSEALLRACPSLRIMATSRQALGIEGETVFRVPSLSLPDAVSAPDVQRWAQYEAVRLFVDRATATAPHFRLTEPNVAVIADICRQLDGVPLAIELAATRLKLLGAEQLAARLGDRFRLLTGGSRTAPERHQTLRATLDWSYQLLSEPERMLLRRLAVFSGGWTLEAAEEVIGSDDIAVNQVLDLLGQLLDKSLVVVEDQSLKQMRFRLLETIRQYAWERLDEAGEVAPTRERHLSWCLQLANDVQPPGMHHPWHAEDLIQEQDNLRAALLWAIQEGNAEAGLRVAVALAHIWYMRGHYFEGRARLAELLALPASRSAADVRASALTSAGHLAYCQGDLKAAQDLLEESLGMWRALDNDERRAICLQALGNVVRFRGDLAGARPLFEEASTINHRLGHRMREAMNLALMAQVLFEEGDVARAEALNDESSTALQAAGPGWGTVLTLCMFGRVAAARGDHPTARKRLEESLELGRKLGISRGLVWTLYFLAQHALAQGDARRARTTFAESLRLARQTGDHLATAHCIEGFAGALAATQPGRAVRLAEAAGALRELVGSAPFPADRERLERWLGVAARGLGETATAVARKEGRGMTVDQAVAYALVGDEQTTTADPGRRLAGRSFGGLTRREVEVLRLVAQAHSNREIAAALVLSEKTVERHLSHIFAKLQVSSRSGATRVAVQAGIA